MLNSDNDSVYAYEREENISVVSLTSHGTKDSYTRHCTSTTMLHKDHYWIIETESKQTKYVIEGFCGPSFDEVQIASSYSKKEVDTTQFLDLFEEIDQEIEEWGLCSQLQTGLLTNKYRMFHVENCYGDSVSVEYPLLSIEIYIGVDTVHHISYGGPLTFSEFRKEFFTLLSEECAFLSKADVDTVSAADFNVTSIAFSGYSLGTLLHEAVGHLLEYDHAQSLGLKAGTGLTQSIDVSESPQDISFGFYPCSDEGVEPDETVLLADGIIQNFLGSFSVAGAPYCHGRAQQCTDLPLPRNTSLKMKRGTEREEALFQDTCVLYVHKKAKPVLYKIEHGIPFYDVVVPEAYVVRNEEFIGKVSNLHIRLDFGHFFDEALIASKMRGNQVGYCVKLQQQVESTQFAPDVSIPVENIWIS
jgi:predicted Zn-dependent protease